MDIKFTWDCTWVISPLKTNIDSKLYFCLGNFIVLLYCLLAQLIYATRKKFNLNKERVYLDIFLFWVDNFNSVFIMYLLMTLNGWVILTVLIGNIIGGLLFRKIADDTGLYSLTFSDSDILENKSTERRNIIRD